MIRCLIAIGVLCALACPGVAQAQVSAITTANLINSSTDTTSYTSVGNVTTVSDRTQLILIAFADTGAADSISSVTCTCFTSPMSVLDYAWSGAFMRQAIWKAVGAGSAATITVQTGGTVSNMTVKVYELTGASAGAAIQTSLGTETAATTTCEAGTLSTLASGSAVIMLCVQNVDASTFAADVNWTEDSGQFGNASTAITHAGLYALGGSDTTPTGTFGSSGRTMGIAVEIGQISLGRGLLSRGVGN